MGNKLISAKEINENGYMVANGKVYDVMQYLQDHHHPGGIACMTHKFGTDTSYDYKHHSSAGKKIWKKYCIGKYKEH